MPARPTEAPRRPALSPAGGTRAFTRGEPGYPDGLVDLRDAPDTIYVRGRVPHRAECIAIVGARAATPYGVRIAAALARDLAAFGFTVVSGLARGIDAAAHRGALDAGGATVAVLPAGLDRVTPPHHRGLAEEIEVRGGLFSEYGSGPPWGPGAFVRRNRLIAAHSSAVVVVEATTESGALSTARWARALGRPLFAVPGDVDRPASAGCLGLLKSGARLCASAADVIECVTRPPQRPESRLLEVLGAEPCALERLAARSGLAVPEALAALLRLRWAGAAESCPGQRWRRVGAAR
ncbi:MAG: DNA-processing protein DprA [Candidatus Eiseniibacteriota bacterium]